MVESLWTFSLHLDPVLAWPSWLAIPFIYLTSAIVGGLGSANLATSLDACGASAGVCGLLGTLGCCCMRSVPQLHDALEPCWLVALVLACGLKRLARTLCDLASAWQLRLCCPPQSVQHRGMLGAWRLAHENSHGLQFWKAW